jgi:hypothetical protein
LPQLCQGPLYRNGTSDYGARPILKSFDRTSAGA